MSAFLKDLRYASRLLLRSPGFTAVALASLALGIGANAAIFTLVNAVLLRPMPVAESDALISVFQTDERNPGNIPASHLNFKDLRAANTVFTDMAAVSFSQVNLQTGTGDPDQVPVQVVTGNYFDVLGVRLERGRGFSSEEDAATGAHPVAVASWPFWQQELGGSEDVVGRQVTLNRHVFTIVGVTPRTFTGTFAFGGPALWVPMAMHEVVQPQITWYEQRRGLFLFPFGRLKAGVTIDQARANLRGIMGNLAREFPADNAGRSAEVMPLVEARVDFNGQGQVQLLARLLFTVVGIVLLIACANLANLLLARASKRRRELAVRLAIGANRARLIRQLLTESLLLSAIGGLLGLGLAHWLLRILATAENVLPFPIEDIGLTLDGRVLAFTAAVSTLTGVLFGLAPALQASRTDVVGAIKQESLPSGEGRGLIRKALVGAQVALCLVSIVAAGLFLRSLRATARIDPGFNPTGVATLTVNLGREGYTPERGLAFYQQLVDRAMALPGAESAAMTESLPLAGVQFQRSVFLDADDTSERDRRLVPVNYVSPAYFQTASIPLLRGRDFDMRDVAGAPSVAIINETMAERFWPNAEALGQRFRFFGETTATEVIGVVRDSKVGFLAEAPAPLAYEPLYQDYSGTASLMIRIGGPAGASGASLRSLVSGIDSGLAVLDVGTLDDQVQQALTGQTTLTTIIGVVGGVALLLASIGLYGVASYWVGMRTREIGVRMALGARPAGVLWLVLRQSMLVVAIGLVIGLAVALLLGPQVTALLVQVSPTDPWTIGGTIALLALVALAACYVPAYRAAHIDPLKALRQD